MTTQQIFELAVKMGIKSDLRGEKEVKKYLDRTKKKYEKLDKDAKTEFDKEKLINPYSDSRILADNKKKEIKKIMVGIDMEGSEMLLAKQMGDIDLILAHHPYGPALADLADTIPMQAQIMANYGIPINIAESLIKLRVSEVSRGTSPINHSREIDMAKILDLDYMCVHSPADNMAASFLLKLIKKKEKELDMVSDVIELIKTIPEYKEAVKRKAGPMIFSGSPDSSCGKILAVDFTGGTSGSKDMYEKMSHYGIGTIIGMHMGEEHRKEAEKYHINVIIAGHIASDSLGMNLFLDELEKRKIEVIPISGLIRIKRIKK